MVMTSNNSIMVNARVCSPGPRRPRNCEEVPSPEGDTPTRIASRLPITITFLSRVMSFARTGLRQRSPTVKDYLRNIAISKRRI